MSGVPTIIHDHVPIYRVARAEWNDPLDISFSGKQSNRWNAPDSHHVLYTSCSVAVARAIVQDIFKLASLDLEDLSHGVRPTLAGIEWTGRPVDMASAAGLEACGFSTSYPDGVEHHQTQPFARAWFEQGVEGVLCRSASMFRVGHRDWMAPHEPWSELAIFVDNSAVQPVLRSRRYDLDWLK